MTKTQRYADLSGANDALGASQGMGGIFADSESSSNLRLLEKFKVRRRSGFQSSLFGFLFFSVFVSNYFLIVRT